MNRRELLALAASAALGAVPTFAAQHIRYRNSGWIDLGREYRRRLLVHRFASYRRPIWSTGENSEACLWKFYEAVTGGPFVPHFQELGDCVGHASTLAAEVLSSVQIVSNGLTEWKGKFSTEITYAGSRVEIGKGAIGRRDGATVEWAMQFLRDYGTLLRGKYGEYDFTKYDPQLAKKLASPGVGVPDELEAQIKEHPVRTYSVVNNFDEVCDSVTNGYPVVLGTDVALKTDRNGQTVVDADGFVSVDPRGGWGHAWFFWGVDSKSDRPGANLNSSWGINWIAKSNHRLGCPDGCAWVDKPVVNNMIKRGEAYAISNFVGYPRQRLDYDLI